MFQNSQSCTRVLVHIADAPCHGTPIPEGLESKWEIDRKMKQRRWDMLSGCDVKDPTDALRSLHEMEVDYCFLKVTTDLGTLDTAHLKYHYDCLDQGMNLMVADFDRKVFAAEGETKSSGASSGDASSSSFSFPPSRSSTPRSYVEVKNFYAECRTPVSKLAEDDEEHVGEWLSNLLTNSITKSVKRVERSAESEQIKR